MKRRIVKRKKDPHGKVYLSRLLFVFVTVFFVLGAAVSAYGEKDLLLKPAAKTDRAPFSVLMDIKRVNGGLVAVGERGHILYSNDECNGWLQAEVPVSVTLTAVMFPTYQKGWAVGHDGVVLHSEDGGKTWIKQLDGYKINNLMLNQLKQMIQGKSDLLQTLDPEKESDRVATLEFELENLDYFLSDQEMAIEEGPTRPLMNVWFKNENEGFIIGAFGVILGTKDGGTTWQTLLNRIDNPDGYHYYGITRSGSDLFIAGEAGMLFRSEDFGETWQKLVSPYEGTFFGITGNPNGGLIAAFGLRGNMFCSIDRGKTWYRSQTIGKASISDGTFLSDGSVCVVGADGTIQISTDQGKTFSALQTRFPAAVAVTEYAKGIIYVAGLRGVKRIDLKD